MSFEEPAKTMSTVKDGLVFAILITVRQFLKKKLSLVVGERIPRPF